MASQGLTSYRDSSTFSFSSKQNEIFDGWKRPAELFNDSGPELYENIMVAKTDCDLVQDITTDCSVVASLCAVMRHLKPGRKDSVSPTFERIIRCFVKCIADKNLSCYQHYCIPLTMKKAGQ